MRICGLSPINPLGGEVVGVERKTTVLRFLSTRGPRMQKTSDRRFLHDAFRATSLVGDDVRFGQFRGPASRAF